MTNPIENIYRNRQESLEARMAKMKQAFEEIVANNPNSLIAKNSHIIFMALEKGEALNAIQKYEMMARMDEMAGKKLTEKSETTDDYWSSQNIDRPSAYN